MKRGIILLIFVGLVGALGGGWWWARSSPWSAAAFLIRVGFSSEKAQAAVDCIGGQGGPAAEPQVVLSGSIEGKEVVIASEFSGRVVSLAVGEGDLVAVDQVLVELDASHLLAQRRQAEAVVAAAQANLGQVQAGTHPAEILAAEAAVTKAAAERDAATIVWRDARLLLDDPQEIEVQIVQGRNVADLASAQIEQAEAQLALVTAERETYRAQGSSEEKWRYRILDYQVKAARAAVEVARANRAGAEETMAALQALRADPRYLVRQVHLAEAQAQIAESAVAVAEAKLAELRAGPTPEQIAVAEAQVAQAVAAASMLEVQIGRMTLRSPIAGVVTGRSIRLGEAVTAGTTLLKVANLDEARLTIYVPAGKLGRVYVGQEMQVRVDSFPDRVFPGTVCYISPEAEFTPNNIQTEKERVDMVFAVRLHLANPGHLLKPGMPADVVL